MKKIILRLLVLIMFLKSSLYCMEDDKTDPMVYQIGKRYFGVDESPVSIAGLIFNTGRYFDAERIYREASQKDSMLNAFTGRRALHLVDWIKKNPRKFIGCSLGAIVAYDQASQSESLLNKFTRGTALYVVNLLKENPGAFMACATCSFLIGSAIASRARPTNLKNFTLANFDRDGFSVSHEGSVSHEDSDSKNSAETSALNSSDEEDELDNWSMFFPNVTKFE